MPPTSTHPSRSLTSSSALGGADRDQLNPILDACATFYVQELDEDAEIEPVPPAGGDHLVQPQLDRLSNIPQAFNDLVGDIAWNDRDRASGELITKTIPAKVAADAAFRNALENSADANPRIEHDTVLAPIVTSMVKDDAEVFKQFMDNEDFQRWMTARVFELACEQASVS